MAPSVGFTIEVDVPPTIQLDQTNFDYGHMLPGQSKSHRFTAGMSDSSSRAVTVAASSDNPNVSFTYAFDVSMNSVANPVIPHNDRLGITVTATLDGGDPGGEVVSGSIAVN